MVRFMAHAGRMDLNSFLPSIRVARYFCPPKINRSRPVDPARFHLGIFPVTITIFSVFRDKTGAGIFMKQEVRARSFAVLNRCCAKILRILREDHATEDNRCSVLNGRQMDSRPWAVFCAPSTTM
jgi:hypothetical protein